MSDIFVEDRAVVMGLHLNAWPAVVEVKSAQISTNRFDRRLALQQGGAGLERPSFCRFRLPRQWAVRRRVWFLATAEQTYGGDECSTHAKVAHGVFLAVSHRSAARGLPDHQIRGPNHRRQNQPLLRSTDGVVLQLGAPAHF